LDKEVATLLTDVWKNISGEEMKYKGLEFVSTKVACSRNCLDVSSWSKVSGWVGRR
jgi:hypothetical protein